MGKQNSKLTPSVLSDMVNSTDFTEREIRLWYKSFRKDCPTGILSLEDFIKLYKDFFPTGDASVFAEHAFRTFDTNGDGTIDFKEFMCALSVTSRGTFEEKLKWAYTMYDLDNDGHVTRKEMLEIIKAIYKMVGVEAMAKIVTDGLTAQQRVDRIFSRMDRDGDEQITVDEFKKAASEDLSLVMLLQVGGGGGANT
uniref:EF-hand domain-containing protein n=1 Tax=Ciona savignyi TaxID=51511 RepID=H2YRY7_CIOSA